MSPKQLLHIAIALVVVVFLWGLVEIIGRGTDVVDERPLLVPVTAGEVDSVLIEGPDDTIVVARAVPADADDFAERWLVNGHEASTSMVNELFDALGDSTKAELVAQNPASHARMGVDSAGGTHVRIVGGDRTLLHLVTGERGRPFRSRYVRLAGDDAVYLLQGPLVPALDRRENDWREKRIAQIDPDRIARVTVASPRSSYTVERRDSVTWQFVGGSPVDSATMARLLEGYRTLTAQGAAFANPTQVDSADFTRPDRRVTLVDAAGDTLLALAFDSTESGYWVRRAPGGTVFELFRWKGEEIAPSDSALSAPRP